MQDFIEKVVARIAERDCELDEFVIIDNKEVLEGSMKYYEEKKPELYQALLFKLPFGKYKGQSLAEVSIHDRGYLEWLASKFENPIKKHVNTILNSDDW